MSWFRGCSIGQKLLMIVLFSSSMALLFASLFLFLLEFNELRSNAQDDMRLNALLIGNRSTAAMVFEEPSLADENLATLAANPAVTAACIFDKNRRVFAKNIQSERTNRDCPAPVFKSVTEFNDTGMSLFEPIYLDKEIIGAIFVQVDLSDLYLRKMQFLGLVFLVFGIALGITFFISRPLLKVISGPILRLVDTVQDITHHKDYSLRAQKENDDELGQLVSEFNGMLEMLENQNKALIATKNRYLALYDDNPTMIVNSDLRGGIISMNRSGSELLKISIGNWEGRSILDFTFSDDIQLLLDLFALCEEHPDIVHKQEIRNIRGDGETIWVRQFARLIIDEKQQENLLIVSEDITETRTLNEKIAYQASHDALTDLVNRTEFEEHLKSAVEFARTSLAEHALCYLDLDQFKVVNDTCGHTAGDELLRQLGSTLKKSIRQSDVLARLGGDEFGILMQNCSLETAVLAAEEIKEIIHEFHFSWEESSFTVGVSIGVTSINKTSGDQIQLLKEADSACYAAKEKGRNRVHVFLPDDQELTIRHGEMQWVSKIHTALEEDRFCLFGQKIIGLPDHSTDSGFHFETLIRLRDEQGELVPPGAFLPAAERYNLSPDLDRWVVRSILKWLHKHPDFLDQLSVCSINLSGLSLSEENFLNFIVEEFSRWSIPAAKICFEITETAAISNFANATDFIHKLKKENCLFSLDDFGSGLSSFGYLKNLPVDFLKIDGLFVKDIASDPVDLAMVRSINEVGHVMGKKTIAEFVENQAILDILKTLNVDYAQGFGIGKPVALQNLLPSDFDLEEVFNEGN